MTRNILAINFKYLGDAAILTPALRAIRAHDPGCALHVLTPEEFAPIYEHSPWVTKVWGMPRRRGRATFKKSWPMIRAIRREKFDRSVDFVGNDRGAIMSLLCGARERLGPLAAGGFWGRRFCYTRRIPETGLEPDWVRRHLQLLSAWGIAAPQSTALEINSDPALEHIAARLLPAGRILCHVATGQMKKNWPVPQWSALHKLASTAGHELVFLTSPSRSEQSVLKELQRLAPAISILPLVPDLATLLAVVKRARMFIAGDTGPLHCAAGLGVPIIGLFGTTDSICHAASLYGQEQVMTGSPCTCDGNANVCYSAHPCLAAISPDDVLRRIEK
ncbi:MAG TPA: glycosyltransferase family 9 protein, partial [Verrucomicrobiae bacterium]